MPHYCFDCFINCVISSRVWGPVSLHSFLKETQNGFIDFSWSPGSKILRPLAMLNMHSRKNKITHFAFLLRRTVQYTTVTLVVCDSMIPLTESESTKYQLKTDNLCCPRIGPGYIRAGATRSQRNPSTMFWEEEIIAVEAAIARD